MCAKDEVLICHALPLHLSLFNCMRTDAILLLLFSGRHHSYSRSCTLHAKITSHHPRLSIASCKVCSTANARLIRKIQLHKEWHHKAKHMTKTKPFLKRKMVKMWGVLPFNLRSRRSPKSKLLGPCRNGAIKDVGWRQTAGSAFKCRALMGSPRSTFDATDGIRRRSEVTDLRFLCRGQGGTQRLRKPRGLNSPNR